MMTKTADDAVILAINGPVATIILSRPAARNALRAQDWRAIPPLLRIAGQEPGVRVILLRGGGGHFGAGNDLMELYQARHDPAQALAFARAMAACMAAIELAAKPVLFGIEGSCYGASVALSLTGDLRIAADNAVFAITPAKLGALYLQSDLHRLTALIGTAQARKLIYTAAPISAAEALRIGLVDDIYPAAEFEQRLAALAQTIADGSIFTLRRSKEMLRAAGGEPPAETDASLACFVEATQGPDFAEGAAAFLEKRAPRFHNPAALGTRPG